MKNKSCRKTWTVRNAQAGFQPEGISNAKAKSMQWILSARMESMMEARQRGFLLTLRRNRVHLTAKIL